MNAPVMATFPLEWKSRKLWACSRRGSRIHTTTMFVNWLLIHPYVIALYEIQND